MLSLTLLIIIVAVIIGVKKEEQDYLSRLNAAFSDFDISSTSDIYKYKASKNNVESFILLGESRGYNGNILIAVLIDENEELKRIKILKHSETYSFYKKIENKKYLDTFLNKSISDFYQDDSVPDAISGATYTSGGVYNAMINASGLLSGKQSKASIDKKTKINIGLPELCLILLYLMGFFNYLILAKHRNLVRWLSIFISIIGLGFIGKKLLTIANIGSFIMGDFPDFQSFFFWYLLLAGILMGIILGNKNHYCNWVCPFGRIQDLLALIGGGKPRFLKYRKIFIKIQNIAALLAIASGIIYRNPAMTSYEVFSGMFAFTGSGILFISLGIFIVLSLFIKNPWCNYACPVKPSINYLRRIRKILLPEPK